MKKLFSAFLAVTFALSSMATETAYVRMKLAGSNPTYSTSTIKLTEDSERTPAYESGYDSERMMEQSNDNSVLFYAYVGTQECANIATNNLAGMALCFNTNNIDQNYRITFELASGRSVVLYDLVANTQTTITQGQYYDFTVDASLVGRKAITDRFFLDIDPADFHSVTTNDYGFCSFASATAVTLPTGLKAYKGDFNIDDYSIALTYIGQVVPANEGVILWTPNQVAQTFNYTIGGSAPVVSDNDFVGAVAATPVAGISADAIYCLNGNALKQYVGTDDIPAGKAYLPVTVSGPSPAPKHISMRFNGTTAVENVEVEAVKAEKFIENGQIFIRRGNEVFNLQGQIVK